MVLGPKCSSSGNGIKSPEDGCEGATRMLCLHYDNVSKTGPAVASPRLQTPMGTLKLRTNGSRGGVRGRGGGSKGEIKKSSKSPCGLKMCAADVVCVRSPASCSCFSWTHCKDARAFPDSWALLPTRRPPDALLSSLLDLIISFAHVPVGIHVRWLVDWCFNHYPHTV